METTSVVERAASRRGFMPLQPRQMAGLLILAGGLLGGAHLVWQGLASADPRIGAAWLGGLLAAAATALGTLPVVLSQRISERSRDVMLGFGAGVMLAASVFSLIVPALAAVQQQGGSRWAAGLQVSAGLLLGAAMLLLLDHCLPHEHFIKGVEGSPAGARVLKRAWLFVFAITLHNLPEGVAIGVAHAGTTPLAAGALTTGIAIQDVPEGLVIAIALLSAGYGRLFAVLMGALSGWVEPLGAVLGATVVTQSAALLPWGLALAAGAMLFVISHEIIPESHRHGHERWATTGLVLGFVLMMLLDTSLG